MFSHLVLAIEEFNYWNQVINTREHLTRWLQHINLKDWTDFEQNFPHISRRRMTPVPDFGVASWALLLFADKTHLFHYFQNKSVHTIVVITGIKLRLEAAAVPNLYHYWSIMYISSLHCCHCHLILLFVTGVEQFRTEQIELSRTRLIRAKLYQIDQDQIVPDWSNCTRSDSKAIFRV